MLESTLKKMQSIAVYAVLHARAELLGEFKRGEHASWDPNQEIKTWEKREVVLAKGEEEESNEEEDESTPVAESPKQIELRDSSKQAESEEGAGDAAGDVGKQGLVESIASHKDITKD